MKFKAVAICFILLCLTSIALAAETYEQDDVNYIDYECPDGYLISGVNLDNIQENFNSTTVLDAYGKEYVLYINNTRSTIGWWTFYVSLQYPNGTIVSSEPLDSFQPFATDADIKIQPFYGELDSEFDVDVYVGILPLTATFYESSLYDLYTEIAYSDVQASCTNEFDFKATYVTAEEFQGILDDSLTELITGSTDLFFDWAWDSILAFVEMIPGVGPYMATALEMSAAIIAEVFFYLDLLFIEYPETTLMTIEFFILGGTLLKTKKKDNMWDMIANYVSLHISVIEFFYDFAIRTIALLVDLIKMVASIVSSLKPI
ncbi:hypothetical protein MettiDRAFT_3016 [Methanolobus tindarius DSM 2278]|uniref:Uncharacterized protein n=1 Tax=Methanolobus tindarius DSM 2278 TaxID=1090322 RepID=W9DRU1_METTI|nr:hypothetical protein [Methanolobus tindarius]ETA69514.1 hypothetical protein MettiDRAFT_3016 [Methanolobus tindarius DSM 2278]